MIGGALRVVRSYQCSATRNTKQSVGMSVGLHYILFVLANLLTALSHVAGLTININIATVDILVVFCPQLLCFGVPL